MLEMKRDYFYESRLSSQVLPSLRGIEIYYVGIVQGVSSAVDSVESCLKYVKLKL